jgi:hypothetical protein
MDNAAIWTPRLREGPGRSDVDAGDPDDADDAHGVAWDGGFVGVNVIGTLLAWCRADRRAAVCGGGGVFGG